MPIEQGYTTEDGKRKGFYKVKNTNNRYTYKPGDVQHMARAKRKAKEQLSAIQED